MGQEHDETGASGNREPFFSIEPERRRAFSIWFLIVLFGFILGYSAFVLSGSDLPRIAAYQSTWWWSEIVWDWNAAHLLLSHLGGDFFYIVLSAFVFTFVIHEGVPISVNFVSYTLGLMKKTLVVSGKYLERRNKKNQQAQRIAELEAIVKNLQAQRERRSTETSRAIALFRIAFDKESMLWYWTGEDATGESVTTVGYQDDTNSCIRDIRQYMRTQGISERIPVYDERGRRIHI